MRPDIVEENYDADDYAKDDQAESLDRKALREEHFLNLAEPEKGYENDAIAQWVKSLAQNIVKNDKREEAIRMLTMLSRADVSTRVTINKLLAEVYGTNALNYGVMKNPELVAKYSNTELTKKESLQSNSTSIMEWAIVIFLNLLQNISEHDKLLSFATKPLLILGDFISINCNLIALKNENTRSEFEKNFKIITKNDGRGSRIINNTFKFSGTAALFLGATLAATYAVTTVYLSFFIYTLIASREKLDTMKSDIKLLIKTLDDITNNKTEILPKDKERLEKALISMQKTRALEKEKAHVNYMTIYAILVGASLLTTPLAPIGLMLMAGAPVLQSIHSVITKLTREEKEFDRLPSLFDKIFKNNTTKILQADTQKTITMFTTGAESSVTPKLARHNSMGG